MSALYLRGGIALTMNAALEIVESPLIGVENGVIVSLSANGAPPPGAKVVDTSGCLVMPGLVNGHTHAGMTLLRGIADDLPLERWLSEKIFPLENRWMSREYVRMGALLASLEMIRGGTTTFNDMYYFAEETARAAHEAGLRAVCGEALTEGVTLDIGAFYDRYDGFLETVKKYPSIVPALAPHGVYCVSVAAWKKVIRYAADRGVRIHTHLSETEVEVANCLKEHGVTPTALFESLGLWELPVTAAHAVCMTPEDIAILGRRKAGVVHNAESNLKLGTKICPVDALRKAGVSVALGTDGTASNNDLDMFGEADTAAKLQSFRAGAGALSAVDAVKLLTIEGARAIGLGDRIGSLEIRKCADIIAIDTRVPHARPLYNLYSHVVYSAAAGDVKHVVAGGRHILDDKLVLSLDEKALLGEAERWGKRIFSS